MKLFTQAIPFSSFYQNSKVFEALGRKEVMHSNCRVSLLLTLILSFDLDSCNNKDILLLLHFKVHV